MRITSYVLFFLLLILGSGCRSEFPERVQLALTDLPPTIDYNFHVKPILSDRCYACHGPDGRKREANFRLDTEAGAYAALEVSGGRAIVSRNTGRSQLVHRILSDDPAYMMPPPESKMSLTDREKAILIRWIEQGAAYKKHWAFKKPLRPEVPPAGEGWARNEIDRFVAAELESNQLTPAPEAQREQLIRRLYFDLTGLPPGLDELDRWLAEVRPDYYERLVDSLLDLPAYGERMATHWLDVARFADSEGYLDDFHHSFSPYRDWVIKAYNKNLPYDQFVLWQLGGDLLPEPTTEQMLATAFNRNHKQNSEGGIIPEEFRVEYVADRTNTLGAAFMGLTVGCARCHDHKYDPVSQQDYYELFAFFNSTIERGDGIFGYNAVENGQMVPAELSMNAGPVMALASKEVAAIRQFLLDEIGSKQDSLSVLAQHNQASFELWKGQQQEAATLEKVVRQHTVTHLTFDDMAEGKTSDLANADQPASYWGTIQSTRGKKGLAVRSDASGQLVAEGQRSSFERMQPFTISFWINIPKDFAEAHVMYNGNNRIQGYRGWDIVLDSNRVHFRLNHAHPYQSIDIRDATPLPLNEWVHYSWTYDGSSAASGMQLFRNGQAIPAEVQRDFLYRSTLPFFDSRATVYMAYKGLIIGNRHYDEDFSGGLLDEVLILDRQVDELAAAYLYDPQWGVRQYLAALQGEDTRLDRFYDLMIDPSLEAARSALRQIQAREIITIDTVREIMVMGDSRRERPTYILDRGLYDARGRRVQRDVPEQLMPWPEDLPRNRLGLGQWLIHPDHPLTARVAVNQMWYLIFGRGIVETVEDFGNQGALPSHPLLLDWLAVDFREKGWNVKSLIRLMVTSATYRQSSRIRPELLDVDPDNLLLARGPRYRRSAEMVRDNILAVSGLLDRTIGGVSTFPYQPGGLWKETTSHPFFPGYEVDYEKGLHRRSLYTFWKRNMPPPGMLIFDAAHRGECQVRRQRSNTPLQALVLLNDVQIIEGCRSLAERVWRSAPDDVEQAMTDAFRLLTGRRPDAGERAILHRQFEAELQYFEEDTQRALAYLHEGHQPRAADIPPARLAAMSRVVNTIMNTTEAYYKN